MMSDPQPARMSPPTWRTLAARARRLKLRLDVQEGRHKHEVAIADPVADSALVQFASWVGVKDDAILRTAVAAALEQLEDRRG